MKLTFCGAAQEVTGSLHLIEVEGRRVALDCGLFQGHRSESAAKNRTFPFDPATLDALIVSHAHIDHTGRIPLLVKQGFRGAIHCTPPTRDLCAIMLADSAHIQEEDARFMAKRMARTTGRPRPAPIEPLYGAQDAVDALRRFRICPFGESFAVTPTLSAEFHEAGHMLGSAGIRVTWRPAGAVPVRLVFSGDIGRPGTPILRDPAALPECEHLICESTYGGRRTERNDDLKERLATIVRETMAAGGRVIIPAFSVGRTQMLVYMLHQLAVEKRLPDVPVFIDSPLAVNATEVFKLHPECYDAEARSFNVSTGDMLGAGCCTYVHDVEQSKALNRRRRPCVIIAASGMCENGRILHHLRNNVGSRKNTVMIVGYQAAHTLGRRLVERQPRVKIFGEQHAVRARIEVLNGFSAHADCDELRAITRPLARRVQSAFLVHGEPDQMNAMAGWMREDGFGRVEIPAAGTSFVLSSANAQRD